MTARGSSHESHETRVERARRVFAELHESLPQQGPGSDASTRRALRLIPGCEAIGRCLDIGCGPGRQTLVLAGEMAGIVVAVDTHAPFLKEVSRRAKEAGHASRVHPVRADMAALPFSEASFELIWCEGAAYLMGVAAALSTWRGILEPGGFLGFTDLCWHTAKPSPEPRRFWAEAYPAMRPAEQVIQLIRAAGFHVLGHFALPEADWWAGYYALLEPRLTELRERHGDDPVAREVLGDTAREIALHRAFSDQYGYDFFVLRAPG